MPWPKTYSLSIHSWINHTWHYKVKKTQKQKKSISLSYCFNLTILHQKLVLDTTRGCRSTQREDPSWVAISYTYFNKQGSDSGYITLLHCELLATSGQWEWEVCSDGGELRDRELNPLFLSDLIWKMLAFLLLFDGDGKSLKKENNQDRNWSTFWQFCTFKWCWNSDIKKVWLICANNWMPQLLKLWALLMCVWGTKANYKRRVTKTCSSCGHLTFHICFIMDILQCVVYIA